MNSRVDSTSAIKIILHGLGPVLLGLLLTGCHSLNVSEPKRTATEQLLLSTAADRGLQGVDLAPLRGRADYRNFRARLR